MNPDRKKPGVAFWATVVAVVALLAYPLSFGPACWAVDRGSIAARPVAKVFRPILALYWKSEDEQALAFRIIRWYGTLGAKELPEWIMTRLVDAAGGLIASKSGLWPDDSSHDVAHPGF